MHTKIEWLESVRFSATSGSGHTLVIDGPPDAGGENAGARPMELMLMGVGGCTSFDVVNILRKSRQAVTGCTTQVTATRTDEVPQVFKEIHIHFEITGDNLDPTRVARAISLTAEKYCSASIMLQRAGVDISHTFEILPSQIT